MQPQPHFGFEQLLTELLRGLADAVADRPDETEAQRFARHQTAIFSSMALLPRDAIETMLAGQCVLLDHLLRDAARDLLRSELNPGKLRIRSQVTALGRLFLKHLEQFYRLRARPEQQTTPSPRAGTGLSPNPNPLPEPDRQTTKAATSKAADPATEAAAGEPASAPTHPLSAGNALPSTAPPPTGKAASLHQRGFQNRRMRRTLQFQKPGSKASARRPVEIAAAASTAPRSG